MLTTRRCLSEALADMVEITLVLTLSPGAVGPSHGYVAVTVSLMPLLRLITCTTWDIEQRRRNSAAADFRDES
jgi:hypothetical protein